MPSNRPEIAPEAWAPAHRMAKRVLGPVERFLHIEAASGVVLLAAAVIGLVWANSPFAHSYEALWHTPLMFGVGDFVFAQSLHFWINEGLMAIFFLVVGLEIRREMHEGELSDLRKAALPIAAAVGGMIVPALLYLMLNPSGAPRSGWGVPMATDIAFAVGVLALLGKRVPAALRVLLLALAIIDDIGAILVIALFYSSGIEWTGLLITVAGILGVGLFQMLGVRSATAYVLPGGVVWAGLLQAGVHPTIGGVILGLLTPARAWFGREGFVEAAREAVSEFEHASRDQGDVDQLIRPLRFMRHAHREALPPVVRVQSELHTLVAYGIMPLFALANAGVSLQGFDTGYAGATTVLFGVLVGLVIGKPVGVLLASFIVVKLGLCKLPRGMSYGGVAIVGLVAGIGFTMAIFIAGLAFEDPALLAAAKLAVLLASAVAATVGFVAGRLILAPEPVPGAALSADEAEASIER